MAMIATEARNLFNQGRLPDAERVAWAQLQRQPDDIDSLQVAALVALRSDRLPQAIELLQRAIKVAHDNPLSHHYLGRVYDAAGDAASASRSHGEAVRLQPDLYVVRLHFGAALERHGDREAAMFQYLRAIKDAQSQGRWLGAETTAPMLRPMVEHAVAATRAFHQNALAGLLETLRHEHGRDALTRVEQALRVHLELDEPGFSDARQRPSFLYFPGLPTSPYLDRSLFPWIAQLEAQTDAIRSELLQLMPSSQGRERVFTSDELERQNLAGINAAPSWNGYYFYRHGERRDDNCRACPATTAALDALPLVHVREHGPEVLYSIFTPGTHLLPHRGVTNTRLVGHLPLVIPCDCALNVGGELHEWLEGRTVVFDDTYEHEAWNRSDRIRAVLIFDIWNPYLTAVEQLAVARIVETIGDLRHRADTI